MTGAAIYDMEPATTHIFIKQTRFSRQMVNRREVLIGGTATFLLSLVPSSLFLEHKPLSPLPVQTVALSTLEGMLANAKPLHLNLSHPEYPDLNLKAAFVSRSEAGCAIIYCKAIWNEEKYPLTKWKEFPVGQKIKDSSSLEFFATVIYLDRSFSDPWRHSQDFDNSALY